MKMYQLSQKMICSNLSKPLPNLIDFIAVERLNYCNMESIMQRTKLKYSTLGVIS